MERDTSVIIYIICGSSWQLKRISNYKLEKGSSLTFLDFDAEDLTEKIASLKNSFFCLVPAGFFLTRRLGILWLKQHLIMRRFGENSL